jgi:hypothetical protein
MRANLFFNIYEIYGVLLSQERFRGLSNKNHTPELNQDGWN